MTGISGPRHHPHPWVDRLHPYMTTTFEGLVASGLYVQDSWLDPMGPRDATFVYTDPTAGVPGKEFALVWDEVTGWRMGGFESGHQGSGPCCPTRSTWVVASSRRGTTCSTACGRV